MTDLPPELDDEDHEPEIPDPPGRDRYEPTERESLVRFDDEDERAQLRPTNGEYQYGPGTSYSGYNDNWRDPQTNAYRELGGLARPDAYFGAIEFDCPTCKAKGKTLDSDGEKCKVWVERFNRTVPRKMPCIARIQAATKAGVL